MTIILDLLTHFVISVGAWNQIEAAIDSQSLRVIPASVSVRESIPPRLRLGMTLVPPGIHRCAPRLIGNETETKRKEFVVDDHLTAVKTSICHLFANLSGRLDDVM